MSAKNKPLTEEQIVAACERYAKGETSTQLGKAFDRSEVAMARLFRTRWIKGGRYSESRSNDPVFLKLRREGKTAAQIADVLKVKVKTVEWWICQAIKAGLVKRVCGGGVWAKEDAETLRKLWATQGPAEISRDTGWSQARISAKARRMGLQPKGYPVVRATATGRTYDHLRRSRETLRAEAAARKEKAEALRLAEAKRLWSATAESRPFLQMGKDECRWPLEGDGGSYACCRPCAPKDTYCDHHRLLAGGGRTIYRSTTRTAPKGRGGRTLFDRASAA